MSNLQLQIVTDAVIAVVNQAKLAHTLQCAVTALAGQEHILRLASDSIRCAPQDREVFNDFIKYQESLGPWAVEVLQSKNHAINLPAVINLWVTFEASIEDLCVSIIMSDDSALLRMKKVNPKLPNTKPRSDEDARRIYEKTLIQLKSLGLVAALLEMLSTLGIEPSIPDDKRNHLNELNYVRNCALHRGSVVEPRKDIEAPTLPLSIGSSLVISNDCFLRYYDAVGNVLGTLHHLLK